MDIFEAIRVFYTPPLVWGKSSSPEERQQVEVDWQRRQEAEKVAENYETYRHLTSKEGRTIALAALELFDARISDNRFKYLPHHILANLAKIVPGSLKGLYPQLIERKIFWADGALYREADSATRDLMLSLLKSDLQDNHLRQELLTALAWIGDDQVQEQFLQWRRIPPLWGASRYFGQPLDAYTRYAGWERTEDGKRRELYYQECYELISVERATAADIPGPVKVIALHEEECPWCSRQLISLFDFDLRDPRLAFLSVEGERIRIVMCVNCSLQEHVYTDVDTNGTAGWSETNGNRPHHLQLYEERYVLSLPQQRLVLGQPRRTLYETIGLYWQKGLSQIGGYPEWVQYPEYPRCPGCQQTMMFVGQLELADILPNTEGMIYAFLCAACGKATTGYQQT